MEAEMDQTRYTFTGDPSTIDPAEWPDAGTSPEGEKLYHFAGDTEPGDAKGDGINGVWHQYHEAEQHVDQPAADTAEASPQVDPAPMTHEEVLAQQRAAAIAAGQPDPQAVQPPPVMMSIPEATALITRVGVLEGMIQGLTMSVFQLSKAFLSIHPDADVKTPAENDPQLPAPPTHTPGEA